MTAAVGTLVQNARKIDPVYLALVALLIAIATFSTAQLIDSLQFLLMALVSISPFLLLSMAAAGGAQATGLDQRISGFVQGRTTMVILGAAFFGSLAPLCSCGVIPLIAALLAAGVPLGPVMAFWGGECPPNRGCTLEHIPQTASAVGVLALPPLIMLL